MSETFIRATRFEYAKVIGDRALQLSKGAQPMVEAEDTSDPISVAKMEWDAGVIPVTIIRQGRNGPISIPASNMWFAD